MDGLSQAKPDGAITWYFVDLGVADTADGLLLDSHFPGTSVAGCPFTSLSFQSLYRPLSCPVHTVVLWLCYELPEEVQPYWWL